MDKHTQAARWSQALMRGAEDKSEAYAKPALPQPSDFYMVYATWLAESECGMPLLFTSPESNHHEVTPWL